MFKELLGILRGDNPMNEVSENFDRMIELVQEMVLEASAQFWGKLRTDEEILALRKKDVQVNKLERKIRKQLVTHLSISDNTTDVPYGLLMMSLVKDVERLGDYAKNLQEIAQVVPRPLPEHALVSELREIAADIEDLARRTRTALAKSDTDEAWALTREGRDVQTRCKQLVTKLAESDMPTSLAVPWVMATRFYKRIDSHLLNLLSSVIMPLHKLDYFDEEVAMKKLGSDQG